MSKWSFGHQIRLDSQNPSTDPHRKLDRRRFESIRLYPMNHAKKATPHLKLKETASKKPKNSSASLDLARLAIPMDYSIVWLGSGSILQVQLESNGQSPCIYEHTRPNRHPNQLNTAEITRILFTASIPMDCSIWARFPSRPNASQGHKSMQMASKSELQYAKFAQAGINHFPLSTAAGVGEAT